MANVNSRVQKYRDALRKAGLRPVQLWVPDTRQPDFEKECGRQSRLVDQVDMANVELKHFMEGSVHDVDGWIE